MEDWIAVEEDCPSGWYCSGKWRLLVTWYGTTFTQGHNGGLDGGCGGGDGPSGYGSGKWRLLVISQGIK
jgi:hypothetical protein